jgi:hypothetical protein
MMAARTMLAVSTRERSPIRCIIALVILVSPPQVVQFRTRGHNRGSDALEGG